MGLAVVSTQPCLLARQVSQMLTSATQADPVLCHFGTTQFAVCSIPAPSVVVSYPRAFVLATCFAVLGLPRQFRVICSTLNSSSNALLGKVLPGGHNRVCCSVGAR